MDYIVYLDSNANELENLKSGRKTMIIRGSMGRGHPFARIEVDDVLYFIESCDDSLVKARGRVQNVFCSGKLSLFESKSLVDSFSDRLMLDKGLKKRLRGKKFLVLITLKDIEEIIPFNFNRSSVGGNDCWIPIGDLKYDKVQEIQLVNNE